MSYFVNITEEYHKRDLQTLGWELTVANCLEDSTGICLGILKNKTTFGNQLYDYLQNYCDMGALRHITEVGGGYGCLMRDFYSRNTFLEPVMIDISNQLLHQQKANLEGCTVRYMHKNFFDVNDDVFLGSEFVILNEVIGDFPTICNVSHDDLKNDDCYIRDLRKYLDIGVVDYAEHYLTVNIGALTALEKLCGIGVPNIFISEHSCEAVLPDHLVFGSKKIPPNVPERINLMGHSEYTIAFSHLENLAEYYNYRTVRGVYADFIPFLYNDKIHFIFSSNSMKDEHEIIRQFIEDLYKYEYLILIKN